jgi:hypothetical protein
MERDNEKIGKKRENPNHSYDEGTGKETEDDGSEAGHMTPQQNSPKRTKKIKVVRDPPQPWEKTRSETRIKTPQRS